MNAQKMTQKSLEALQAAQSLAVEYENQALCPEHLFCALLSQQDGLIPQLFQKMGAEPGNLAAAFAKKVGELPHVTGTGRDPEKVYITPELDRALTAAEKSAAAMKDEYVSVEHLVLGMMDAPNAAVKEVLRQFSLDKTRFLEVLAQVRGNQRVTSDNPESTYDVLAKYGQDLVELARQQKLDPVIGRDPQRHPYPFAQDKKQPCAHRRAGRGQNSHRRGPGPAYRARRCTRKPEGPQGVQP